MAIKKVSPQVTKNPYVARAYCSSPCGIPSAGWNYSQLQTVNFDPNSNMCTTNAHAYTAPITGKYQINVSADRVGSITGIMVNGNIVSEGVNGSRSNVSDVVSLTAGDIVRLAVYGNTNNVNAGSYCTFLSVAYIGQ